MKFAMKKDIRQDLITYGMVVLASIVVLGLQMQGVIPRSLQGQLVPVTCYIVMALSLNLVVGVAGDLSLGHAGFMSVGAFTGVVCAMGLSELIPDPIIRLVLSMLVGALFAAISGILIGIPVLRLRGDYLAIVTLAFGEIIKEIVNSLLVGVDAKGLHVLFNLRGDKTLEDLHLMEGGIAIIKGAQGASGTTKIASFVIGIALVLITLAICLNLVRSRAGRAIMAVRDNRIAAESVGLSPAKYRLIAFAVSAALAGAAGALYAANFSQLSPAKFDFNTSILVLVFVVLGGLGNMRGSIIAAALLTILPEALRGFSDYRMLVYAIVLILVMLFTSSPQLKQLMRRLLPQRKEEVSDAQ
ncbi:branched-chain amino acid ABC transporter permease [Collinsella sp. zg1085]|uniref:branched-chain amino acid ABC transporter permease n=1 Tax=Collinsella sp. zg1085 TaxID=2844380 RepID=UPI001C0BEB09|nr:branched-chain amino acid ABC transporter permease [Collinsella sp. zg1085]QWT18074.1 branched-chain amino acid ABC transporter permease [Collinsella sp. zg1085]